MDETVFTSDLDEKPPVIYASDIDKFLYCRRAFWYRLQDEESSQVAQMEQGTHRHEVLARKVRTVERIETGSRALIWITLIFILIVVVALAWILLGV